MDNGGDPPTFMQSWGARALAMFDEELQELEQLNQLEEESYHAELEQAKVQAMEDAEHLLRSSVHGGDATSPEKRKPPSAKGRRNQNDDAVFQAAKSAKILEERTLQLQEKSARQPWRQMAQHYVQVLEDAQRATKPVLQWERKELDFFTSHKLEYYTMGDVLAVERPRPADAGDAVREAEGLAARPSSAPPAPAGGDRGGRGATSAGAPNAVSQASPQICLGARAPSYIIDAVAFADEYNKALEKEYAYKVELGTHHMPVSSTHTAAAKDEQFMRSKLATHKPGLDMAPDDFCAAEATTQKKMREAALLGMSEEQKHTFFLPSLVQNAPAGGAASTYSGSRGIALKTADASSTTVAGGPPLSNSLTLPSLSKMGENNNTNTADPATRKAARTKAGTTKRGRSQPPLTSSTAAKKTATTKKGSVKGTDGIECSLQSNSLDLRTCAGQTTEVVVRFTNRRAFRTRLRVLASTHPWLRYSCSRMAPAAGSAASAPAAYETPLSSGGFVEVTVSFSPQNMSTPQLTEVLKMGVARELNSRDGEGAQWAFLEIPVHCETVAPTFVLRPIPGQGGGAPQDTTGTTTGTTTTTTAATVTATHRTDSTPHAGADAAANTFVFPHTIVLATSCILYELENLGSNAIVNLLSDSPCFAVAPGPEEATALAQGQRMPLAISFSPKDEGPWEAHLSVVVRETSDGAVLAEHPFTLHGEGVAPRVRVVQIGGVEVEDTGRPQWRLEESEGAPRFVLEQSTPGVLSRVPVLVCNDSVVPLRFAWRGEVGGEAAQVTMEPAAGTLPPQSTTTFTASVTPKDAQPLLLSWNLFLKGLPQLHELTAGDLDGVPEDVLDFYSTDKKLVPSAAMLNGDTTDVFSDPFFIFQHRARPLTEEERQDSFATGLFLYALPVMPQMVLIPQRLEEAVDCLIRFENARRVTLQNRSPRPLHFFLDPTAAEWPAMAAAPDREGIAVRCVPRTGVVPPFSDVRVTVYFTVQQVGPCRTYVNCYVPEMAARDSASTAMTTAAGSGVLAASPAELGCLQLLIDVTGAGPSVHTSTEYLDFGLVEMNKEVEASFTVTNDNPIAVEFDLQDPMMREPPRFVFLPPSFRLGPGDSIEVTVYRKGVSVEDEQTFFEIVVRDGATIAIETRATIQSAMMMVDKAQVNFHEVPEGEWQEGCFYLTNLSALDVPFTIEPGAAASPFIELDYTSQHTLHAGQRHVAIPLRARFFYNPAVKDGDEDALRTLIGLRNGRVGQILLVEVFCERVQRLAVDVQITGAASTAPLLLTAPTPTTSPTSAAAPSTPTHYDPVVVRATLEEASPIAVQPLTLEVTNRSGCVSSYQVRALTYIDLPTVTESALEMIKKKKLLETASKSGKSPRGGTNTTLASYHPTTTATAESAVGAISADRPTFWATAQDGTELQERRRREALAVAQKRLVDGRGCATTFLSPASGQLGAYGGQRLHWTLTSNFPGRYEESLRFQCGALPEVVVPVTYELRGKPLLLDPTTSGLTMEGDLQVLVMPSVIAPLGTSHRKLRLLNRVPRDVAVQVQIFLGTSAFTVVAVDETVEAAQVTLTLAPLSEAQQQQETVKGKAQVSPTALVVRAMASVELTVEYTPEAAMVAALMEKLELATAHSTSTPLAAGDESDGDDDRVQATREQEATWEGSLVIATELAETEYNDTFYMDEFYTQHAAQYPSTRALSTTVAGPSKAVLESVSRPLQTLSVQQPLRTRPGRVVVRSRLLQATEPEQRRLQAAGRLQEAAALHAAQHTQAGNRSSSDDDDDAHTEDEATYVPAAAGDASTALRPVEELLAEQEERNALIAYVARRRTEAVEESRRYFLPVELRLRARCGVPRLAVQPSAAGVYFPPYQGQPQGCSRTVRLTNRNRATLHFQLSSTDAAFEVVSTRLLAAEVEEDPLVDELDDVTQVGRRSARQLQWMSLQEQQQAERMLHGQLAQRAASRQKQTAAMPFEAGALYSLRCGDAMDVLLHMTNGALLQQTRRLQAALRVDYPSQHHEATSATEMATTTTNSTTSSSRAKATTTTAAAAAALSPVSQTIPLIATYVVAEVRCQPEVVWFRPGQTSHDGRAQPAHAQRLTLSNLSPEVVQFELVPISSADTALGATSTAKDGRTAQLTKMRKLREVLQLQEDLPTAAGDNVLCVRDVPGVFQLSADEGLLPPATAGGQPGTSTISIYFREHSNVRYESAFCVYVNGSPTDTVVLLRGDSREPEI